MIDNKDIKRIELTFESHCCIDLDEVFNMEDGDTNPFAEGKVKQWWVKWGTLYMDLHNGSERYVDKTVIQRDVSWWVGNAYENVDTKWPTAIMLEDEEGNWHRRDVPNTVLQDALNEVKRLSEVISKIKECAAVNAQHDDILEKQEWEYILGLIE
tara:strand:- start:454 stop:918 length:465 start_codon:yes stop_codon:yes gene_type:complete